MEFTSCQKDAMKKLLEWWSSGDKQYFVLSGYAGCVDLDTEITTSIGIMTVRALFELNNTDLDLRGFEHFNHDIKVRSHDGSWNQISDLFGTEINTSGFKITLRNGKEIKVSENHPFQRLDTGTYLYVWTNASQLVVGDRINSESDVNSKLFSPSRIVSIETITQKFYDISICNTGTYIGNGIVCHNTGKSTIVNALVDMIRSEVRMGGKKKQVAAFDFLDDYTDKNTMFSVKYMTPTGKAAQVLRKKGLPATTIHSAIYKPVKIPGTQFVNFVLKGAEEFFDTDLFVVDEGSMLTKPIFEDILSFNKPVIILGDPGQLPCISDSDDPEERKFNIVMHHDAFLDEITRQAEGSPIIQLSFMARTGKFIPQKIFGPGCAVFPAKKMTYAGLAKGNQLLCGTNATRNEINANMREFYGFDGSLPNKGEKLICLQNDYDNDLINGLVGECKGSTFFEADIFNSGEFLLDLFAEDTGQYYSQLRTYAGTFLPGAGDARFENNHEAKRKLQKFDFGYAISVHKSQGSQWDYPIVFEEPFGDKDMRRRWMYTAITRAAEKLIILRGSPADISKP